MKHIVAILFFPLMLTGCLQSEDQPRNAEPEIVTSLQASLKEEPQPAPKAEAKPEVKVDRKAEIEKWNSYVDLANEIETGLNPALNKYFEAFGNGPTYQPANREAKTRNFIAALSSPGQLAETIDQALLMAAREPKSDLDQNVSELAAHLKTLRQHLLRAREYHAASPDQEGDSTPSASGEFQPSAPDEAQALHAKIHDAFQNFTAAYGRFRDGLNRADAERRKRDIQEMDDQGLVIRTAMLGLIDHAQELQDMLSSHSITSETLQALDMDQFSPLYDEFMKSADNFEKTLADPQQPAREKLKLQTLGGFTQQLMVVRASATSLMARYQLKTKALPFPEETPGTPEHFGRVLGDLVDLYNAAVE